MKLSFSTKGWHDSSFEDFCTIAKELKFQGIELHNIHNRLFNLKIQISSKDFHFPSCITVFDLL